MIFMVFYIPFFSWFFIGFSIGFYFFIFFDDIAHKSHWASPSKGCFVQCTATPRILLCTRAGTKSLPVPGTWCTQNHVVYQLLSIPGPLVLSIRWRIHMIYDEYISKKKKEGKRRIKQGKIFFFESCSIFSLRVLRSHRWLPASPREPYGTPWPAWILHGRCGVKWRLSKNLEISKCSQNVCF